MRLIDADDLIEKITASIMLSACGRTNGKTIRTNVLKEVRQMIADAPTVEAEPVIHGRWITDSFPMDDGDYLMERCTACGTAIEYGMGTPYCPFCGAKMEDEGEDDQAN